MFEMSIIVFHYQPWMVLAVFCPCLKSLQTRKQVQRYRKLKFQHFVKVEKLAQYAVTEKHTSYRYIPSSKSHCFKLQNMRVKVVTKDDAAFNIYNFYISRLSN